SRVARFTCRWTTPAGRSAASSSSATAWTRASAIAICPTWASSRRHDSVSLFRRDLGPGSDDDRGRGRDPRRGAPPGGPPRRPQMPMPAGRPFRTLGFWALVMVLSLLAYRLYQGSFSVTPRAEVSYTRFIHEVDTGNINNLQILENNVTGELKHEQVLQVNGRAIPFKAFKTNIVGNGENIPDRVWKTNPGIEIEVRTAGFNWLSVLITWVPLIVFFAAWMFVL